MAMPAMILAVCHHATQHARMPSETQTTRPLDAVDREIVALLQQDAKRTLAELGEQVALSVAAVKRRVDRLERDGVIRGYTAIVDAARLGRIDVLVEIYGADRTSPADVRKSLERIDEVVTAFTVSGEPDALVRLQVDGIPGLERAIERLRRDRNIVRTRSMIVLSTIIDRPAGG
jgi:Lrp/AsnC family transcriptional regulator, leucine-responsive regulatory protein